jgi:hypothetical protein
MLVAAADTVVVVIIFAAITVDVIIIPVAVIALAFILHHPLVLSSCRLVVASCLPLLLASLPHFPL